MNREKIIYPKLKLTAFHCPHCHVFSRQDWFMLSYYCHGSSHTDLFQWSISKCSYCHEYVIWHKDSYGNGVQIYPKSTLVEEPNEDLNAVIKKLYAEAAEVKDISPRSAAALLRLALQELCKQLGEDGKNINDNISNLVRKGLPTCVQKALDSVRIIGNNAVHPGEINVDDNIEIVNKLFGIINFIADQTITREKEINAFYANLPEKSREAVEKRDQQTK